MNPKQISSHADQGTGCLDTDMLKYSALQLRAVYLAVVTY